MWMEKRDDGRTRATSMKAFFYTNDDDDDCMPLKSVIVLEHDGVTVGA